MFDLADTDASGVLTINEFFAWTLGNAGMAHGKRALELAFNKYDADCTGMLDGIEFSHVCEDLGFGAAAQKIFAALDTDSSGSVPEAPTATPPTPMRSPERASSRKLCSSCRQR